MNKLRVSSLALAFSLLAGMAGAADYKLGALEIDRPWARATAPTAPAGGGFLTIVNKGTTGDRLVAARSPVAQTSEIHEMKMEGNVMRMRELGKGIEIPAGGTVTACAGRLPRDAHGPQGTAAAGNQGAAYPGLREGGQHRRRAQRGKPRRHPARQGNVRRCHDERQAGRVIALCPRSRDRRRPGDGNRCHSWWRQRHASRGSGWNGDLLRALRSRAHLELGDPT